MPIPELTQHVFKPTPFYADRCDARVEINGRSEVCGQRENLHTVPPAWKHIRLPTTSDPAPKHDGGKPRWDLLPWDQVEEVVAVLTDALGPPSNYPEHGWRRVEDPRRRYFSAAVRHLFAWWVGKRTDPQSGRHALAHAICCLLFLMWFDNQGGKDAPRSRAEDEIPLGG